MKSNKRTLEVDLETAIKWHNNGGVLGDLAEQLFTEDELASGYLIANKRHVKEIYSKCCKKFPVGTLVWSDEGSDKLPNLIISEPFIDKVDNQSPYHMPYVPYNCDKKLYESVYVKTVRFDIAGYTEINTINIERVLDYHTRKDNWHKNMIIDKKEYQTDCKSSIEKGIKEKERLIKTCESQIETYKKKIEEYKSLRDLTLDDVINNLIHKYVINSE